MCPEGTEYVAVIRRLWPTSATGCVFGNQRDGTRFWTPTERDVFLATSAMERVFGHQREFYRTRFLAGRGAATTAPWVPRGIALQP